MPPKLYSLRLRLLGGRMSDAFRIANPEVSRTLQFPGDQTLGRLALAIEATFGLDGSDHQREFHFGPRPWQLEPARYMENLEPDVDPYDAPLDDFGLRTRSVFWYRMDFGEDWYFEVKVVGVGQPEPDVAYPREIDRLGDSPEQYPDWDEAWEDDEDEEGDDEEEGGEGE